MTYYISNSWQVGTQPFETFNGDRYGVARNDTFQLSGSEAGALGGIRNGWEKFYGGAGEDRIYVAPKYNYVWTAILIDDKGLNSIERIEYDSFANWGAKPVYFWGSVDFSSVKYISSGVTIFGRGNDNTFIGGITGEVVEGDGGNDTLYGNDGSDRLFGDSTRANPWVANAFAAGNDKLYGGDGNDYLNGQGGDDILFGDAGDDELHGEMGNDQLSGGDGADKLFGDAGNDQLRGGAANDELRGGDNDDLLDGGMGRDILWGGAGADTFQFVTQSAVSLIEDFAVGIDKLRFHSAIADEFSDLTIVDDSTGYASITVGDVEVILNGVSSTSLNSSMFEFGVYA